MGKPMNLIGQRFTMLEVIKKLENNKEGKSVWMCLCDCGNKTSVIGTELKAGRKKSCGCAHDKLVSISKTKHGKTNTPEHKAWGGMKERCLCKTNKAYENYGGRGIKICEEWIDNFEKFLEDMGERPSKTHSLDRINNNEGYNKNNCRWATLEEQNRNKRTKTNKNSNIKGISYRRGKYEVRIMVNKKRICLGSFVSLEQAVKARTEAELKYWN